MGADLDALQQVRLGGARFQLALDVVHADHDVAQIVREAGSEPAHGGKALEMEELLVGRLHFLERRLELVGTVGEQADQVAQRACLESAVAALLDGGEELFGLPGLLEEAEDAGLVDGGDQRGRQDAEHRAYTCASRWRAPASVACCTRGY